METNKDIIKDNFNKNGYCVFNLKDLNIELYNFLEKYFLCNQTNNIKDVFYNFRFDSDGFETAYRGITRSFEDADLQKNLYLADYKDSNISQCWFYNGDINDVNRILLEKNITFPNNLKKILNESITDVLGFFYNEYDKSEIVIDELQFSLYNKGCRFVAHYDGPDVNLCAFLIYLNKDYKKENGGLLIIDEYELLPEFGTVCLMDISKHSLRHGVTEVVGEDHRYAILCFPKLKSKMVR